MTATVGAQPQVRLGVRISQLLRLMSALDADPSVGANENLRRDLRQRLRAGPEHERQEDEDQEPSGQAPPDAHVPPSMPDSQRSSRSTPWP